MKHSYTPRIGALVRILSSLSCGEAEKLEALNEIEEGAFSSDRIIHGLLSAMEDESIQVRNRSVKVLTRMLLEHSENPEEQDRIMRHIMRRIFGRIHDTKKSGHLELFRVLRNAVTDELGEQTDNLFVWIMQEAERVQKVNYRGDDLPGHIANFFDSTFQEGTSKSKTIFTEIAESQFFHTLTDHTTPNNYLKSVIRQLGKKSLSEIPFNLIIAHIAPVLNKVYKAKLIVSLALENLEKWVKEFPRSMEAISNQRFTLLSWKPEATVLPELLMKQMGMNVLLVEPLIQILIEEKTSLANKGQIFRILKFMQNIRRKSNIERISKYTLQIRRSEAEAFPYLEAIDMFTEHLTGLDAHQSNKEDLKEHLTDPLSYFKSRILIREHLEADEIIQNTLLCLGSEKRFLPEVNAHAWEAFIRAQSPNLLSKVYPFVEEFDGDQIVLQAIFSALGSISYLDAFDLLKDSWNERHERGYDQKTCIELVRAIGQLGNREILGDYEDPDGYREPLQPTFLLAAALDEQDQIFEKRSKEGIVDSWLSE